MDRVRVGGGARDRESKGGEKGESFFLLPLPSERASERGSASEFSVLVDVVFLSPSLPLSSERASANEFDAAFSLSLSSERREREPVGKWGGSKKKANLKSPPHLADALVEYAASLEHAAAEDTELLLLLGSGTMGSGIGLGTVLLARLAAKKSAEVMFFIVGGGAFAEEAVEEAEEELAATLLAGLAMTV